MSRRGKKTKVPINMSRSCFGNHRSLKRESNKKKGQKENWKQTKHLSQFALRVHGLAYVQYA